jgi:CDGSH-type Zn-finger protein
MNPIAIEVQAGQTYWWCRCGRSARQPFCDGAHKGGEFSPLKYVAAEAAQVWFCVCKKTSSPPFCDGSHNAGGDAPCP